MKIGIFESTLSSKEHIRPIHSLVGGMRKLNLEFFFSKEYKPCDIAVSWGVYKKIKKETKIRSEIMLKQLSRGRRTLVVERGYLKRDSHFSIGFDSQNGWADFNNKTCPTDRWSKLGINLKPKTYKGDSVLFCGQVPWDTAVQDIDYIQWCKDIVKSIREVTDRNIIFRPHPLGPDMSKHIEETRRVKMSTNKNILEDFKETWCAVAYNSNALVEAAIEGIPVFAFNNGAMTWEIANKNIANIENPKLPPRQQWAANLAYTQWTLDEMKLGLPLKHLLS